MNTAEPSWCFGVLSPSLIGEPARPNLKTSNPFGSLNGPFATSGPYPGLLAAREATDRTCRAAAVSAPVAAMICEPMPAARTSFAPFLSDSRRVIPASSGNSPPGLIGPSVGRLTLAIDLSCPGRVDLGGATITRLEELFNNSSDMRIRSRNRSVAAAELRAESPAARRFPGYPDSSAAIRPNAAVWASTCSAVVAGEIRAIMWNGVKRIPSLSM